MRKSVLVTKLIFLVTVLGVFGASAASAVVAPLQGAISSDVLQNVHILAAAPAQMNPPAVTLGNKKVTVAWTAPSDNGSPITGYTVTSTPDGLTCTTTNLQCIVTGLSNETSYTFTVRATNSLGSSMESLPSSSVTPTHVPKLISNTPLSSAPGAGVLFSDDGRYVYWGTESGTAAIVKYDLVTKSVAETLTLPGTITSITGATKAQGFGFFYYAAGYVQVDLTNMSMVRDVATTYTKYPAMDSDGNYIFASTGATTLKKLDSATGSVLATYTASGYEFKSSIIYGGFLFVARQSSSSALEIQKFNIATLTSISTFRIELGCNGCNFSTRDFSLVSPSGTAILTYHSDDQFSSLSGNLDRVATVDLSSMSLTKLVTFNNGSDYVRAIQVVAFENSDPYGYWFASSSLVAESQLLKINKDSLSVAQKLNITGLVASSSLRVNAKFAHVYEGRIYAVLTGPAGSSIYEYGQWDVPSSPLLSTVVFGDESATATWSSPTDSGYPGQLTYTASAQPGGAYCVTTSLSCSITGLTNGTNYTIKVIAQNTSGFGQISNNLTVIPKRPASAIETVTATYGSTQSTVTWSPPTDSGGSQVSTYTVTSSPGGQTCTTALLTCTVTGLTNGTTYTFTVTSTNGAGVSQPSTISNSVFIKGPPTVPQNVTVLRSNQSVAVSWGSPASNEGSEITSYSIMSVPAGGTCEAAATSRSCVVTGLTNGISYTFQVRANNSEGSSPVVTSSAAIPMTVTSALAAPTGTPSNGRVDLTWFAPSNLGGSNTVIKYVVTSTPTSLGCENITTSCVISGLTNGLAYTFHVQALNEVGLSPSSPESSSLVPRTVPSAPTGITGVFGNGAVTLAWSAPASDGGATITSYKAVVVGNTSKYCQINAPSLSCTINGLTNGTAYTFTVSAINIAGTGAASIASSQIVPKTVPSAPSSATATPQDQALLIAWSPGSNGGSSLTSTLVTVEPGGYSCRASGVATSCTVTGLANGTSYVISISHENLVGAGPALSGVSASPNILPLAPKTITTAFGNARISVAWTSPDSNGGTPVTGYKVTVSPGTSTCQVPADVLTCEVSGLTNGTAYSVSVRAINALGQGASITGSSTVIPRTIPNSPASVTALAGPNKVTVAWVAPSGNGSAITSYSVRAENDPNLGCVATAPATSCVVTNLTNGTRYRFTVEAANDVGTSIASVFSAYATPVSTAGAPTNVVPIWGNASSTISWAAPIDDGGTSITMYTVVASPGGKSCSSALLECTITGLQNGQAYRFTVTAVNSVGSGLPSTPTELVTPWGIPSPPTGIVVEPRNASALISWTPPTNTELSTTEFIVVSNPGGYSCQVTGTASCIVEGLANGTAYNFAVVSRNRSGTSQASQATAPATPRTTPAAPLWSELREFTIGQSPSVIATWTPPSNDGGSRILSYTVTASPSNRTCSSATTTCTITGLQSGQSYTFTIVATNAAGNSAPSVQRPLSVGATPPAPMSLNVTPGHFEAKLAWNMPLGTNLNSISSYEVVSSSGEYRCTTQGATFCKIAGIYSPTALKFRVRAINSSGASNFSQESAMFKAGPAIGELPSLQAVTDFGSLHCIWRSPGIIVANYTLKLRNASTGVVIREIDLSGTVHSFTMVNVDSSTNYVLDVSGLDTDQREVMHSATLVTVKNPPMFLDESFITGELVVGNLISVNSPNIVGNPSPRLTGSWYRCGLNQNFTTKFTQDCKSISGAQSPTYKLTSSDFGRYLIYAQMIKNVNGSTFTYAISSGVVKTKPVNIKAPTLSGKNKKGSTLKVSQGSWLEAAEFSYTWYRCPSAAKSSTVISARCVEIWGEASPTYLLTQDDVGKYIIALLDVDNEFGRVSKATASTSKILK
jgi:hypothetical protein